MTNNLIYAIDPSDTNINFINKMCSINNINNCITINNAISDNENLITTNDNIDMCSFIYNTSNNPLYSIIPTTLDSLYNNNIINNIGFIHLDAEGFEWKIIKGSDNLIKIYRPIIAYEIHYDLDKDINNIKDYLENLNYIILTINEILLGNRYDCRNILAVPNEIYNNINYENLINEMNLPSDILIPYNF